MLSKEQLWEGLTSPYLDPVEHSCANCKRCINRTKCDIPEYSMMGNMACRGKEWIRDREVI